MEEDSVNINKRELLYPLSDTKTSKYNYKKIVIASSSFIFLIILLINIFNFSSKPLSLKQKIRTLEEIADSLQADGYASLNGGTMGGKGGKTVTVNTLKDLKSSPIKRSINYNYRRHN